MCQKNLAGTLARVDETGEERRWDASFAKKLSLAAVKCLDLNQPPVTLIVPK